MSTFFSTAIIGEHLMDAVKQFAVFIKLQDSALFTAKPRGNWSSSEHLAFLSNRVKLLNKKIHQPKFLYPVTFDKNESGVSKSPDDIKEIYHDKILNNGGPQQGLAPKAISMVDKDKALLEFLNMHKKLMAKVSKIREEELDKLMLKESPIGPITLREMLFYHIYDILKHLQVLKER